MVTMNRHNMEKNKNFSRPKDSKINFCNYNAKPDHLLQLTRNITADQIEPSNIRISRMLS